MPDKHVVLISERRNASPRKMKREVVYATMDEEQAKRDAKLLQSQNKKRRYYVMPYQDAVELAEMAMHDLEKALDSAAAMRLE